MINIQIRGFLSKIEIQPISESEKNFLLNFIGDSKMTLAEILLDTNTKILYEASKYDKIWGIGFDEDSAIDINPELYGQNLLGKALMETRIRLSEIQKM